MEPDDKDWTINDIAEGQLFGQGFDFFLKLAEPVDGCNAVNLQTCDVCNFSDDVDNLFPMAHMLDVIDKWRATP